MSAGLPTGPGVPAWVPPATFLDRLTIVETQGGGYLNGQPGVLSPTTHGWASAALTMAANTAYLTRFVASRDVTARMIAFGVSTAAGADDACDVAIYNSTLTRLVSTGATTGKLNSTGVKTMALTPTLLESGLVYYAAISLGAIGGTAAQIRGANFGAVETTQIFGATAGFVEGYFKSSAHPLPAGPIATPTILSIAAMLAIRES